MKRQGNIDVEKHLNEEEFLKNINQTILEVLKNEIINCNTNVQ